MSKKQQNTFRFQSFAERIEKINVNIIHRVKHVNEDSYDYDNSNPKCFFAQSLDKWTDLNLTETFKKFRAEFSGVFTLTQVLYEKDRIAKTLVDYLIPENYMALEPILDALVSLAKDLQKEFYPYYRPIFRKLIGLIKLRNSNVIEWTFQALAHLFKFLWRFFIKDLPNVLARLMPLFRHPKRYIEDFAADSFAFIGRKVRDQEEFIDTIVDRVYSNGNKGAIGCGKLLYSVLKGIHGHMHTCHQSYLPIIFKQLAGYEPKKQETFAMILKETFKNIFKYVKATEDLNLMWRTMIESISHDADDDEDSLPQTISTTATVLDLLDFSLTTSRCAIHTTTIAIDLVRCLCRLFEIEYDRTDRTVIWLRLARISTQLLNAKTIVLPMEQSMQLTRTNLEQLTNEPHAYLFFILNTVDCVEFDTTVLPHFLRFCQHVQFSDEALRILTLVLLRKSPFVRSSYDLERMNCDYFINFKLNDDLKTSIFTLPQTLDELTAKFPEIVRKLIFIGRIRYDPVLELNEINRKLIEIIVSLSEILDGIEQLTNEHFYDPIKKLLFLQYLSLESLIRLNRKISETNPKQLNEFLNESKTILFRSLPRLLTNHNFLGALRSIDLLLHEMKQCEGVDFKLDFERFRPLLVTNVCSPFHEIRLLSLHCLLMLSEREPDVAGTRDLPETKNIYWICYEIERIRPSFAQYRQQIQLIDRLVYEKLDERFRDRSDCCEFVLNFLWSVFYINFSLLWEPASVALKTYAIGLKNGAVFWSVCGRLLREAYENAKVPKKFYVRTFIYRDRNEAAGGGASDNGDDEDEDDDEIEESDIEMDNEDADGGDGSNGNDDDMEVEKCENETGVTDGDKEEDEDEEDEEQEDEEEPEEPQEPEENKSLESYGIGMRFEINDPNSELLTDCDVNDAYLKNRKDGEEEGLPEIYIGFYSVNNRINYMHVLIYVWKVVGQFANVTEANRDDFLAIFFDFLNRDYYKGAMADINVNWMMSSRREVDFVEGQADGDGMADDNQMVSSSNGTKSRIRDKKLPRKQSEQILIAQLKVLAKWKRIRDANNQSRGHIYQLIIELLSHRNQNVQMAAFECIEAFKFDYIHPYAKHLMNLIDEKRIRMELIRFRLEAGAMLGSNGCGIRASHRAGLIPIIFRIVQSKLLTKQQTKGKKTRKNSSRLRKEQICRFLSQCEPHELKVFVAVAFAHYKRYDCMDRCEETAAVAAGDDDDRYTKEDNDDRTAPADLLVRLQKRLDFRRFPAPKRLLASLSYLKMVLKEFSHKLDTGSLRYLVRILCVIGAILHVAINDTRKTIFPKFIKFFRSLRTVCLQILNQFFTLFESYRLSDVEENLLFDIFVWPIMDYFPLENLKTPTTLMKIFLNWSLSSNYCPLLVKKHPGDQTRYPLRFVINLLESKQNLSTIMVNNVMSLMENLLKFDDEENVNGDDNGGKGQDSLEIANGNADSVQLSYGYKLLLPDLAKILVYFQWRLKNRHKNTLNRTELFILSKCSQLTNDRKNSRLLLSLLLPIIYRRVFRLRSNSSAAAAAAAVTSRKDARKVTMISGSGGGGGGGSDVDDDEDLLKMLETVRNLLRNLQKCDSFLISFSRLFSEFRGKMARRLLCEIFEILATKVCRSDQLRIQMFDLVRFLQGLNAWQKNSLEDLDYDRILRTFQDVQKYIETNQIITYEFTLYIVETCLYYLKHDDALTVRDWCKEILRQLIEKQLSPNSSSIGQSEQQRLIEKVFFVRIRNAFKHYQSTIAATGCISTASNINGEHIETFFLDCIQLLGQLAKIAHESNPILRVCGELLAKSKSDSDFFEFVSHHFKPKRYEALNKFNRHFPKIRKILTAQNVPAKTFTEFLWPIIDSFLCNAAAGASSSSTTTTTKPEAVLAAIEALGSIASVLQWSDYQKLLMIYLNRLQPKYQLVQKQLIKIIVAILDAFHFDLTNGTAASKKILENIQSDLLPHLNKSLAQLTVKEDGHKSRAGVAFYETNRDEDLMKIPVSIAVVKLLQKLPDDMLKLNVQKVFMKMCTFLRSRSATIRKTARETLEKMMDYLGTKYLNLLLNEMFTFLNRGYKIHVLTFTIHAIIKSLKTKFEPDDIDTVLYTVLEICMLDIYGETAEEKEVEQIQRRVDEAKKTKSYDLLEIVAELISEKSLIDLLRPIKEILDREHSHKITMKTDTCLKRIVLGLIANQRIASESLLIFVYGLLAKNIPELVLSEDCATEKTNDEKYYDRFRNREENDTFLLAKEPVRNQCKTVARLKIARNSNAPLFCEFALRLCYFLLKRSKLDAGNETTVTALEPFMTIFVDSLRSNSVRLVKLTVQCLFWFVRMNLPFVRPSIGTIVDVFFTILHKYATAGLSKGENLNLVIVTFKIMAQIISDYKAFEISEDQLKLLLLYIEQDLNNYERQANAFNLLKAIIARQLIVKEMYALMIKVGELSIQAESRTIRLTARSLMYRFLMGYPLRKRLRDYMNFYLKNIAYELEAGRESALDMMLLIVRNFPRPVLAEYANEIFIAFGSQLVNDESAKCKRKIANLLTVLLRDSIDGQQRDRLFEMLLVWLREKLAHRRLALQLAGFFAVCETERFGAERFTKLFPVLVVQLSDRVQETKKPLPVTSPALQVFVDDENRMRDHLYYQLAILMQKILQNSPISILKSFTNEISIISLQVKQLLSYSHEWVRMAACEYFVTLLKLIDVNFIGERMMNKMDDKDDDDCGDAERRVQVLRDGGKYTGGFICARPHDDLMSLTLDFCDQLQPSVTNSQFVEQVIRNLTLIARLVEKPSMQRTENKLTLLWLVKRLRKIGRDEARLNNSKTTIRYEIFKWIGSVAKLFDTTVLEKFAYNLLKPLVQETHTTLESHANLKEMAETILPFYKAKLPLILYTRVIAKIETEMGQKRLMRKRKLAELAIRRPEVAAEKRVRLQKKKADMRKRKAYLMREFDDNEGGTSSDGSRKRFKK